MRAPATLEDGVARSILRMSAPMVVGLLAIGSVGLVDAFFIGRLGTRALAAFGFAIPVVAFVGNLLLGFGVGITSAMARAIGAGQAERGRAMVVHAALLGVPLVGGLTTAGLFGSRWLVARLGAPPELQADATAYLGIWFAGLVLHGIVILGTAALRATGETRSSAVAMLTAALANLGLAPLLILGVGPFPRWELRGAAAAAVLSFGLAAALTTATILRRRLLRNASLAGARASVRSILAVAVPAMATYSLAPAGLAALTSLVAGFGAASVAAYSVATRIEYVVGVVPLAVAGGLSPLVGYGWGAGRRDLIRDALLQAGGFVVAWGLVNWLLLATVAPRIAAAFVGESEAAGVAVLALRLLPGAFAAAGLVVVVGAAFNAIGEAKVGALLGLLRSIGFPIPLAALGAASIGIAGLFAGVALGSVGAVAVAVLLAQRRFFAQDGASAGANEEAAIGGADVG
jgi:MATE family, multidrug efflux pump